MSGQSRLHATPLILSEANTFVKAHHRHHLPSTGHRWSVGVRDESDTLRGVAITSRPVARMTDQYASLEIVRVATDGCPNACSFLYGLVRRIAKLMGYASVFTFILESEPGTSLRAAGYVQVASSAGGSWSRPSRKRDDDHPLEAKTKWVAVLDPRLTLTPLRYSLITFGLATERNPAAPVLHPGAALLDGEQVAVSTPQTEGAQGLQAECPDSALYGTAESPRKVRAGTWWEYNPGVDPEDRCGTRILVRKGKRLEMVWRPCKSRSCPECIEVYVGNKMEPMLHDPIYAVEIASEFWPALQRKLYRYRQDGKYAPVTRIPTGTDMVLVVSAYPIGEEIDPLHVELALRDAEPEWGNVTQTGWRVEVITGPIEEPEEDPDSRCYGVAQASAATLIETAQFIGVKTVVTNRSLVWLCNDEQARVLVAAANCIDPEHYKEMRSRDTYEDWI